MVGVGPSARGWKDSIVRTLASLRPASPESAEPLVLILGGAGLYKGSLSGSSLGGPEGGGRLPTSK